MGPGSAFDGQWCWGIGLDGGGYPDEASDSLWSPFFQAGDFEGDRLYLEMVLPGEAEPLVVLRPAEPARPAQHFSRNPPR